MLQQYFIASQKAIVGGLAAALLSGLAIIGVTGDMTVKDACVALANYVVTHLAVWYTTNKK
jgi:hypothetical protein